MLKFVYKVLCKIFRKKINPYSEQYVQLRDQAANDYVREEIAKALEEKEV